MLERWRENDIFHKTQRRREGAPVFVFYEGPPTANGAPAAPRPHARLQGHLPALQDDARLPRAPQGGLGHPRPAGRARGRGELGITASRRSSLRRRASSTSAAASPSSPTSRSGKADRAHRLLGRHRRRLLSPPQRVHRVGLVGPAEIWDKGLLYQGHKVVPYCPRCGTALSSHEVGARATRTSTTRRSTSRFPVTEPARAAGGRATAAGLDDDAVDAGLERRASRSPGRRLRARRGRRRRCSSWPRAWSSAVLGEDAEVARPVRRRELAGTALRAAVRFIPRGLGERGHTSSRPTSSPPRTAPASSTPPRVRRGRLPPRQAVRPAVVNPVGPTASYRRAHRPVRRPLGQGRRPGIDRRPRASAAGCSRVERVRAHLPVLLALRHAAALLRQAELVHPHDGGQGRSCSRTTRTIDWYPEHISTAASATGSRTTSTGRCRASATGARRCPSGAATSGHDALRRLDRRARGDARRATSPRGPAPALHRRRHASPARVRRRDAPRARGDRRLVRLGRDAVRPVALPVRERRAVREALPGRLHLRGHRPDARLVLPLLAVVDAAFERPQLRNACSASGLILDPEGQKMSKSRGNVVGAGDVLDAPRRGRVALVHLHLAAAVVGLPRSQLEMVGEGVRKFLLTLWNTYRFFMLYANIDGFDPRGTSLPSAERPEIDRWLLSRLNAPILTVTRRTSTPTTRPPPAGRSSVRRRPHQLVRAPQPARFWRARATPTSWPPTRRLRGLVTVTSCSRRSRRSSPRSCTRTSTALRGRCISATTRSRRRGWWTAARVRHGGH